MNVILLLSDTFRYDNLFDRAAMPVRTPNLDRFAERAVSLSRMYAASFPTIPHRTDLTSGRFGWPWYGWQDRRSSTRNHMPELFGKAGYVSQLLCDCPHLFKHSFQYGFTAADVLRGQEGDLVRLHMNDPITESMPREKTRKGHHFQDRTLPDMHRWTNAHWRYEADRFAPRTAEMAVRWLEDNYRHHPWLLWVDFFDPHEPWDPPEYMVRRYHADYDGPAMIHPNYGRSSDYTEAELANLRAHYCAEAELVDRAIGRVLEKIDDLGLWDNSIVVFSTDHGASLGDHDRTGKTNINDGDDRHWPIYPEVAHVPFMITAPDLPEGREVDAICQPPDIFPTLAELADVNLDPPEEIHGRSFASLLGGASREPFRELAITASQQRPGQGPPETCRTTPVVYTDRWAYVPVGPSGERELFDLTSDPNAETNLAADHPDVVEGLHERALDWLRQMDAPSQGFALFE